MGAANIVRAYTHAMNTRPARASVAFSMLLAAGAVLAHHSFAMFDQTKTIALQGAVKELRWTNPHVFIQVLVKNAKGAEDEWSIEMTSPEHLSRTGWRPGTLKPGDKVTLTMHPLRNGNPGGSLVRVKVPDGRTLGPGAPSPN